MDLTHLHTFSETGARLLLQDDPKDANLGFSTWILDAGQWLESISPRSGLSAQWLSLGTCTPPAGKHRRDGPELWHDFDTVIRKRLEWLATLPARQPHEENGSGSPSSTSDTSAQIKALARQLRQEFGRAREALAKTGKPDFKEAEAIIEALRALDESNGHVWYYKGEIRRISNPERFTTKSGLKASTGPLEMLHEYQQDFLRYLEIASALPESETGGAMSSEVCYERPKGFCVQRTAWIHHLLAIDFYEAAMATAEPRDRAAKLTRAAAHAKEARKYQRPEGGEGFDQGIDTTALQMKIADAESKAGRQSVPGTGHLSGRALHSSRKSTLPIQDLSRDALIAHAPRMESDGQTLPALGGIPLLAKLGQGGMGAVYYGIHPRLNKEVAVKVLPFHLAQQQPDLVDRFFREAQMAASVQSPHLVGVTDVNEESGLFYLVMEFVPGVSAGSYLKEMRDFGKVGISETSALDICIAATAGLAAAHAAGIVHRDVKPDNILIPKHGDRLNFAASKLADLGLARSEELSHSITSTQACMGTPGFMSPEQAMDAGSCGMPSDIFSMGATLYALLAGKAPFSASTLMKVLMATRNEPHVPLGSLRADVSKATAEVVDRCLAKAPTMRFTDGAALLSALTPCRTSIQEPAETIHLGKRRDPS